MPFFTARKKAEAVKALLVRQGASKWTVLCQQGLSAYFVTGGEEEQKQRRRNHTLANAICRSLASQPTPEPKLKTSLESLRQIIRLASVMIAGFEPATHRLIVDCSIHMS